VLNETMSFHRELSRVVTKRPQGYRYNAVTVRGMSGSPVFDTNGRVVGIHGQGE